MNYTYGTQSPSCPGGTLNKRHAVVTAGANTYCYDPNGNQVRRTVSGSTYTLGYDEENRLTSVSGAATATFTFDGDGNRVKSVVGATTTSFVGSHYETSGGVITKYYLAGGTRVAMRKGSTFYWLLSDHLGSTSKVATSAGSMFTLAYDANCNMTARTVMGYPPYIKN